MNVTSDPEAAGFAGELEVVGDIGFSLGFDDMAPTAVAENEAGEE